MDLFSHKDIISAIAFANADEFDKVSTILAEHDKKINLKTHEYKTRKDFEMLVGMVSQLMLHLKGSEKALIKNKSHPRDEKVSLLLILRECIDNVERYRIILNCASTLHQEYYRFDKSTR
ncbi:hypothetical protein JXA85_07255 [Candidatus Woesearchaeota archaeon]|nr:hypothetical protein [Candidatus Woesearchaeota archaeon]